MKKVLLLSLMSILTIGAYAQFAQAPAVAPAQQQGSVNLPSHMEYEALHKTSPNFNRADPRWYDIVDAVDQSQGGAGAINGNISANYLWKDSTILAYFGTTVGNVWVKSVAQTFDPVDPIYNDPAWYSGLAHVNNQQPFTLDSVAGLFIYNRNPAKVGVVDTLIVSLVKGQGADDINVFFWSTPSAPATNHGTDTLRFAVGDLDFNTQEYIGSASNIFTQKIPLTAASANDTTAGGWNQFAFPVNMSVPAGNKVCMAMSFSSGETWATNADTVWSATNSPGANNKSHVLFAAAEEVNGAFQTYTPGAYNMSALMQTDTTGWGTLHVPSFGYTAATYAYEHMLWQYKVNSPASWPVGFNEVAKNVSFEAYPNPTDNLVSFSLNLEENAKQVNVGLYSTTGQLVKTLDLGSLVAGNSQSFRIDVSDLAAGMYIFNLNVDGQKLSDRLMVK